MSIKTAVFLLTTLSTAAYSLKCFVCDDPTDKLCRKPKEETCDVNQTSCYVMNYYTFKWKEQYALRGCYEKCSEMHGVNRKLETSFDVDCCESDLCNAPNKGNKTHRSSSTKAVEKSGSAKLKQRNVENKSEHTGSNTFVIVIALSLSFVVKQAC